jgi:hypothetical protein
MAEADLSIPDPDNGSGDPLMAAGFGHALTPTTMAVPLLGLGLVRYNDASVFADGRHTMFANGSGFDWLDLPAHTRRDETNTSVDFFEGIWLG